MQNVHDMDALGIYNVEAENSILGAIFLESDLIKEIELRPEHFFLDRNRIIFENMKALEVQDIPIDFVTLVNEIGNGINEIGGVGYLTRLASSVPTAANFKFYERLVIESWKMRRSVAVANRLREDIEQNRKPESIGKAIQELSRIEESGYEHDFNLRDALLNVYNELQNDTGELTGVPTGFNDLDKYLHGWQNGDLIIMGARPSMGKTAFMLNVCGNAAEKDTCVDIFSLEMNEQQLIKRMLCAVGNIDATKMRSPKTRFTQDDWNRLHYAMRIMDEWDLKIHDNPSVTVQEIRATLRRRHRESPNKKHLAAIDYLQLIQGSGQHQNRTLEIGEMSRALKGMARDFNQPVICLSQLNRGLEQRQEKRPVLSDLRESGNVEQDADAVLFIHREDYYDRDSDQKNLAEIIISKQRNGPVGSVDLAFLKEFNKFADLADR